MKYIALESVLQQVAHPDLPELASVNRVVLHFSLVIEGSKEDSDARYSDGKKDTLW